MLDLADPELLTRTQAARLLNRSAVRVHQLGQEGRLPFVQTPLGRLYRTSDVQALARELEHGADRQPPAQPQLLGPAPVFRKRVGKVR